MLQMLEAGTHVIPTDWGDISYEVGLGVKQGAVDLEKLLGWWISYCDR